MKIALITPQTELLDRLQLELQPFLTAQDELLPLPDPLSQVHARLRREKLQFLILELVDAQSDLASVEALTVEQPGLQVLALARERSPDLLMQAMRSGVREVLPLPLDSGTVTQALTRLTRRAEQSVAPRRKGEVLAVLPVKGGAGATLVLSNLAYALAAEHGQRVIVIDLNLPFGEAESYLTTELPQHSLCDLTEKTARLDEAMLNSALIKPLPNLGVLATGEHLERSVAIRSEQVTAVIDMAAQMADFVFLDINSTLTGLGLAALDRADRILPVMEAAFPVVRNAKRLADLFRRLGYTQDKILPILNRHDGSGLITAGDIEKAMGVPIWHTLPNRWETAYASLNQGVPLLKLKPKDALTRHISLMASSLLHPVQAQAANDANESLVANLRSGLRRWMR